MTTDATGANRAVAIAMAVPTALNVSVQTPPAGGYIAMVKTAHTKYQTAAAKMRSRGINFMPTDLYIYRRRKYIQG